MEEVPPPPAVATFVVYGVTRTGPLLTSTQPGPPTSTITASGTATRTGLLALEFSTVNYQAPVASGSPWIILVQPLPTVVVADPASSLQSSDQLTATSAAASPATSNVISSSVTMPATTTDGSGIVTIQTGTYTYATNDTRAQLGDIDCGENATWPSGSVVGTITANLATVLVPTSCVRSLEAGLTSAPRGGGVSTGTVAGAAVGAAIGAAILGFLAAFCLFRRKRSQNRGGVYMTEKAPAVNPWDNYLPQSADDGEIRRSVDALYGLIDQHVENYYSSNAMPSISETARANLRKADSELLPASVEQLLSETVTPLSIIKHCYAATILSRISPGSRVDGSLLPAELARLPQMQPFSKSRSEQQDKAMSQAYNYWRVLTTYLMYPQPRKNGDIASNGKDEVIGILVGAFEPWAKPTKGGPTAEQHLSSILKSATETGVLVLSQRSTFVFEWDVLDHAKAAPGRENETIVVMPAFEKTADERGEMLARRQVLVKPKTESIAK